MPARPQWTSEKIQAARRMVRTGAKLQDIALALGFKHHSTVGRFLHSNNLSTPTPYREKRRRE